MKAYIKKKIEKICIIDIVLLVGIFGIGSALIHWLMGGRLDDYVLKSDALFGDFYFHIAFASAKERIYNISYDACFPPLAYVFYYFLWSLNPYENTNKLDWTSYRQESNNMLIFLMYNMVLAIVLMYYIQKNVKIGGGKTLILTLAVVISYPFMATSIQRGNSTALVALLLCFVFLWKDSESKVLRELALILIAVAAGFKIYPAFVGIIYIIEKRYREAFRLLIYGVLFFFVPFLFFGGIEGFKNFVWLLIGREQEIVVRWGTIRGICNHYLMDVLGTSASNTIGFVLENVYLVLTIAAAWCCKKNWKRIFLITAVLVIYVQVNWMYTLAYLLPAFLFFIMEEGNEQIGNIKRVFYGVLWGIIYSIPCWMLWVFKDGIYEGIYKVLYAFILIVMVEELVSAIVKMRERLLGNTGYVNGKRKNTLC